MAALAALVGMGVHSLVDSFPSVSWALLVGLYAAYVLQDAHLDLGVNGRKLLTAMAMLLLLGWTYRMFQYDRAQVFYERALNTGEVSDAYHATDLDPDLWLYKLEVRRLWGESLKTLDVSLSDYGLTMYGRRF